MPDHHYDHQTAHRFRGTGGPTTSMGHRWEAQQTRWIYLTFIPVAGAFAYFHAGRVSGDGRYSRWGAFLLLSLGLPLIALMERNAFGRVGAQSDYLIYVTVLVGVYVVCLISGIVHALHSRQAYLRAVEALELGREAAARAPGPGEPPVVPPPPVAARPAGQPMMIWQRAPRPARRPDGTWGARPTWSRARPGAPEYQGGRDAVPPEMPEGLTDVNNCSVEELAMLPGITTILAKRLDEIRKTRKGFDNPDQCCSILQNLGLNPHELETLRPMITTSPMASRDKRRFPGRVVDY